jgi:hypothetical protein
VPHPILAAVTGIISLIAAAITASAAISTSWREALRVAEPLSGGGGLQQVEFRVARPIAIEVRGFVGPLDRLSIVDIGGETVWSVAEGVAPAEKNGRDTDRRSYAQGVSLLPGRYRFLCAVNTALPLAGQIPDDLHLAKRPRPAAHCELSLFVPSDQLDAIATSPMVSRAAAPGEIRLAPLGVNAFVRARFRMRATTLVVIRALGEANAAQRDLADRSWLVDLTSRSLLWSMEPDQTVPAGGARKNRLQVAQLRLEAGDYELVAVTDDSHSFGSWNAMPPDTPDEWGVSLQAPPESWSDAVSRERIIVRLVEPRDDDSLEATVRVGRPTRIRVYALGEWSGAVGQWADHGWIDDVATGAPAWRMRYESSRDAGGSSKNRFADESLVLGAGTYRVRYVTDDSHSSWKWNQAPPADPQSWGITLSTFEDHGDWEVLEPGFARVAERAAPGR